MQPVDHIAKVSTLLFAASTGLLMAFPAVFLFALVQGLADPGWLARQFVGVPSPGP